MSRGQDGQVKVVWRLLRFLGCGAGGCEGAAELKSMSRACFSNLLDEGDEPPSRQEPLVC